MSRRSRYPILYTALGEVTPPVSAESWWLSGGIDSANVVGAWRAIGAASQAASKINLAGGADLTDGATVPAWDDRYGWQWSGGGAAYYETGWTPSDPSSIIISYDELYTSTYTFFCGVLSTSPTRRYYIFPYDGGMTGNIGYGANDASTPFVEAMGTIGFSRNQPYADGAALGSAISLTWDGAPDTTLPIGARYTGSYDAGAGQKTIRAVAIYSVAITAGQMAALHTAMMALTGPGE